MAKITTPEVNPDDEAKAKVALVHGQLRGPLLDAIMEPITRLALPWNKLTEQNQKDFIASMRSRVDANLQRAVEIIVASEAPTITAALGDFTVKKMEIAGKFTCARTHAFLQQLGDHGIKPVQIVLADPDLLDDGSYEQQTKPTPDQQAMPLYDGDNTDLAGEQEDDDSEG